jgi:pimeloyl-ACP methyl ester carboxylesterase
VNAVDGWVRNEKVYLHYLDTQSESAETPIIFIPGLRGSAEQFRPMIEALGTRRALAISLRGRGQSGVPDAGYSFDDHVRDIVAVVEAARLTRFCLLGHSIGVTYTLGYALDHPQRVSGLILGGYPAQYPAISADWIMQVMMKRAHEMPVPAALGVQHESVEIPLWERLIELTCPMLVLRGGKETSRLKPDAAEKYLQYAPNAQLIVFEESGHRLWQPDFERFMKTVRVFLGMLDHMK